MGFFLIRMGLFWGVKIIITLWFFGGGGVCVWGGGGLWGLFFVFCIVTGFVTHRHMNNLFLSLFYFFFFFFTFTDCLNLENICWYITAERVLFGLRLQNA